MTTSIEISNLSFSFPDSGGYALRDIDLEIGRGEFIAVLGPNGSGKTTLGLCMTGVIPHFFQGSFQGRVLINGRDTREHEIHDIVRDVGILLQDYESQIFFPSIEDEIGFQMENFGIRAGVTPEDLHITHLLKRNLFELSEGEKQKAIMASILLINPGVLILDEPTSQLDSVERHLLLENLRQLNNEGKTIILITHDTHAARYCSRFIVINDGVIVRDTTEKRFLERPSITSLGIEPVTCDWSVGDVNTGSIEAGSMISIEGLSYEKILVDVNAEIKAGEFVLVLGPNGSGKTTLVKHLVKLLDVQEGVVRLDGKRLEEYSQRDIAAMAGFIFQNPGHQIFRNTVVDELRFTLEILGRGGVAGGVEGVLKDFNLEDYGSRSPQALSTGEKQRVALASVLVSNPDILILDEPMTYLDYDAKKHLINYLRGLKMNGKTVIVVSHHPGYYASLSDRVFLLDDKRLFEQ